MSPKVFIIDKNRNLCDFLCCKISINKITKKLYLTLEKSDSKKIVISFKRTFIYSRNFLCVLNSKNDSNYYVLTLPTEETCLKMFNVVQKGKKVDAYGRFRYRKYIEKLLRKASVQTKLIGNVYEAVVDEHNELILRQDRKRKLSDVYSQSEDSDGIFDQAPNKPKKKKCFQMKKIYDAPFFKTETAERKGIKKPRLLIFPNEHDKTLHFEYGWDNNLQCYRCCSCWMKVEVFKNEDGKEFAQLKSFTKHFCSLQKYDPSKYTVDATTRIVENGNFKVIKYTQKGIANSKLFIFDPTNKKLCRGYIWDKDNGYYLCIGCNTKSQRIFARVQKNADGNEYLMLSKNEHVCELREYNPGKYKDDIVVNKPLFEHVECTVGGVARKYLLIFTDESKKYYYKFSYENGFLPICTKCDSKNLYIQAYVLTDDNGNECVSIRNKKHICNPIEYNPADFSKNQIIKPPGYQLIKRYWRGRFVEKLAIFDPTDSFICYELTKQPCKTMKKYICNECHHKHGVCVTAWITHFQKDDEHVELNKTQHKCKPIKFENPNSTIVNLPNFKVIKSTKKGSSGKSMDHLLIYPSSTTDKKILCYRFYFDAHARGFVCHGCERQERIIVSARIFKDEYGEDFVQLGENQHICEPQPEKTVLQRISTFYNICK